MWQMFIVFLTRLFFLLSTTPQDDTVTRRVQMAPAFTHTAGTNTGTRVPHLSDTFNFSYQGYLAVTDHNRRRLVDPIRELSPRATQDTLLCAFCSTMRDTMPESTTTDDDSSIPFASFILAQRQDTLLGALTRPCGSCQRFCHTNTEGSADLAPDRLTMSLM